MFITLYTQTRFEIVAKVNSKMASTAGSCFCVIILGGDVKKMKRTLSVKLVFTHNPGPGINNGNGNILHKSKNKFPED